MGMSSTSTRTSGRATTTTSGVGGSSSSTIGSGGVGINGFMGTSGSSLLADLNDEPLSGYGTRDPFR
jgi:hypothetical protein